MNNFLSNLADREDLNYVWQAYGVFLFLWQFAIPLIFFIFAYWKVLGVVRRQTKIDIGLRRMAETANEPVAGTSGGVTETATETDGSTSVDKRQKEVNKGSEANEPRSDHRVKGQHGSTALSKAKINIIKVMIYIIVCFVLCWMPKNIYVMSVRHIKSSCICLCFYECSRNSQHLEHELCLVLEASNAYGG